MTPHIVLFVGPGPSLSTELLKLEKSFAQTMVLAPASPKGQRGTTVNSIESATNALWAKLNESGGHDTIIRLSVWAFEPTDSLLLEKLWNAFGLASWIELLPPQLASSEPAILTVRQRMTSLPSLMGCIANEVYTKRRSSPLPLPLRNFSSRRLSELTGLWYQGLTLPQLEGKISTLAQRFRQYHSQPNGSHHDDKSLIFTPAKNSECHGKLHPLGSAKISFINGRFRFGSALYAGFHYDVKSMNGNLSCYLYDSEGNVRDMRRENRTYINIFPNNLLLPARS
jgi:hypothetical protein